MRFIVHDYGSYGFTVELARALARLGHEVLYVYFHEVSTGKGALRVVEADPSTFSIRAVSIGRPMQKYSIAKRFPLEASYGRLVAQQVRGFCPDAVISANTPLVAQLPIARAARRCQSRFVIWQQDIVSFAMAEAVVAALPRMRRLSVGQRIARGAFVALERRITRRADHVVVIAPAFRALMRQWGIPGTRVSVIPNWAPLAELPVRERDNGWRREQGLSDKLVYLYSGTLGLKHDPSLLLRLADAVRPLGDAQVVVISEGMGADWLRERQSDHPNLRVLPFQPYDVLPHVYGAADVLVAILEPSASDFSVPSKILSYLCAGRPILASLPQSNHAAKVIADARAGVATEPSDPGAFIAGALDLGVQPEIRAALGQAGREFAERTFDIDRLAAQFEEVLRRPAI